MVDNKESNHELFAAPTTHEMPSIDPSSAPSGTHDDREMFCEWLIHNQNMDEPDAQNCSSIISLCEDLAASLGFTQTHLYGVDYAEALDITSQLKKTAVFWKENGLQNNRYNSAIRYYLLYLQGTEQQETAAPEASANEVESDFERFFDDPKYKPLYEMLKLKNITTLEGLKEVNLWKLMNIYGLYTVKERLDICNELNAKLRDGGTKTEESGYIIHYNGTDYKGGSPSEAFVSFLNAVASKYPLRVRNLLGEFHPSTRKVVLSRCEDEAKLKLTSPAAYVDAGLSSEQAEQYTAWVLERCSMPQKEFTVQDHRKPIAPPAVTPPKVEEKPAETYSAAPSLFDKQETEEAEKFLRQRDTKGATYEELRDRLRETMTAAKEIANRCPRVMELNGRLYHADALVDFEEGADALERILDKLIKKSSGITTAKPLYDYARGEMSMFLNDNGLTDQQSVYDFARYLFEKLGYHGKRYVFSRNSYISLPGVPIDTRADIIIKYARENGPVITFGELETHLNGLAVKPGNINDLMKIEWKPSKAGRIDKQPLFLIYDEDKCILAERLNIDETFLETVHTALRKLFEDCGGYVIPRRISAEWYQLLPDLPESIPWTPMLLQQLIIFYPNKLEAESIMAMDSQNSSILHAMFVEKDSDIQNFRDAVWTYLKDEMPDRNEFEAEELRGILKDAGMLSGNELIWRMPKALGGDYRFLWISNNSRVKVRM